MKRRKYSPVKAEAIGAWFRAHPDEYLTIEDIAAKWGVSVATAHGYITTARVYGHRIERVSVYRIAGDETCNLSAPTLAD